MPTCVIQEQEVLGIIPIFWKDEPQEADDPAILRLPMDRFKIARE